ncbi:NACHT, LRR and PYD domains-containing protein 8 [Microtus ochrogaster]|uniref:NACHT, LRR and PYD domains-containing protein 8 n=1 Tax=Microtus ochrogaster TaxID=79684 RepID=A0ABM1AX67_MICOH|nr:NACHT, LRR and PYD domains-containing protein 8 [Microtus ochrogaster]
MSKVNQRSSLHLNPPSNSSNLTSTQTWTHTPSLDSPCANGVMVYMSYLSKTELQTFKELLMEKKLLPDSLGITWKQLNGAKWAEMVHLLVEYLPGALAWNVAREILEKMNQRRISSLLQEELEDKIREYKLRVMGKNLLVCDTTIWPGNQADFLYINVRNHDAILPCLFLPRSPQGRQPKTVVIHGIPGIGKTTLARKTMLMWAQNKFYAHKFKFAFYFHCRELNWVRERSFSELIEGQGLMSQALVSKILSRPDQLLLLLDGFEELTSSLITRPANLVEDWNQKLPGVVLLSSLLSKRMLPEATLLIMVRPTSWRGVKVLVKRPSHVTLTGFRRTETLDYLRSYFKDRMKRNQVVDFAMKNTILLSMCRVPVVCWMVCHCLRKLMQKMVNLTEACPNATSVCVLFLATLFPTIWKKLSGSNYQKQLEGVCRLAAHGVWDLKSVFDKTDFQHVKVDEATIDAFLQVNILRKLKDKGDRYVFALFIFQEIFGALFYVLFFPQRIIYYHPLSQVGIQDLIAMSRSRENCETQMGLFLFGLLNEACAGIVMRSFKCGIGLGNKRKAISVITHLNDYGCYDCSQLFPCLTEIGEESFVCSALESYQKVFLKLRSLKDLQLSAFCLRRCRGLEKVELTLSRAFYQDLWPDSADPTQSTQLRENKIVFSWWEDICSVFETETNKDLEVLMVTDSILEALFIQIITTTLQRPQCKVQRLQLKNCEATFIDWILLTSNLQRNSHLKAVLLTASSPNIFGVKYLLLSYLRELMLENCNLTEDSCQEIALSLSHSKLLTHLSLAENDLKDEGSRHIWNALEHLMCPLQRLVLRQCSLTSACCKYMMSPLRNNKSLQSLDLSFNRLMDDGVILLCKALEDTNCNLLVLELEQCWFTSASCRTLASMLCRNRKLRYLDLSKNIIRINGMLTLALEFFRQRRADEVVLKLNLLVVFVDGNCEKYSHCVYIYQFLIHRFFVWLFGVNVSVGVDHATIADHLASIFENHLGPVFWGIIICIVEDMKLFMLSKKAKNEMKINKAQCVTQKVAVDQFRMTKDQMMNGHQSSFMLRNKIQRQTKVNKVKKMSVANDKGIQRGGGVLVSLVCSPEPSL